MGLIFLQRDVLRSQEPKYEKIKQKVSNNVAYLPDLKFRVVHSGDKPFKCDMCEKAFNRKDTLESHLSSHSDLKPFMCSVCGQF